jgi:hypothetical protein
MTTLLAQLVGEGNVRFYKVGEWIEVQGHSSKAGWHVSVFPKKGNKGILVFDEFHVTEELRAKGLNNNHHFYSDEGYIQQNHLDTVVFSSEKWKTANQLAAEIYQQYLKKYVTAEMLDQQVKDVLNRGSVRRKPILSVEEHQSQQAAKAEKQARAQQELQRKTEEGEEEEEVDMFAFSDEDEPSQPVETLTTTPTVEPVTTSTSQPLTTVPSAPPGTGESSIGEKKRKADETQTSPPGKKSKTEKPDDQ